MIIGNDILPNVFINNIEVYDNKIKYDVVLCDNIVDPVWSNKKYLEHDFKLQHAVVTDQQTIGDILRGDQRLNSNSPHTNTVLVSEMQNFEIDDISSLSDQVCYVKTCTYSFNSKPSNLTIFANVIISSVNTNGPTASESVFVNSQLNKTTNILYKDRVQYYGPVHYHEGIYMEGRTHSTAPHSVIDVNTILNLKIKDYSTKHYALKGFQTLMPIPAFSKLFSYFDENTSFEHILFINLEELIISNTKFGHLYYQLDESHREQILDSVRLSSIRIKRHSISKNGKKIFQTKNILSGFESVSGEYNSTFGEDFNFISHGFGRSIRGITFKDSSINSKTNSRQQYEIELYFNDVTIEYFTNYKYRLSNAISFLESFAQSIHMDINYDKNLRKTKNNLKANSFVVNETFESFCYLHSEVKSFLYSLTEEEKYSLEVNNFSLINPHSCTIESVQFFTDSFREMYNKLVRTYGLESVGVGNNYTNKVHMRKDNMTNRIFVNYKFKNIVEPYMSETHYTFEERSVTTGNVKVRTNPYKFGQARNQFNFAPRMNPFVNKLIMNKFKQKSPAFTVFPIIDMPPEKEQTKFNEITDYLGDSTNLNSFTDEEKCEQPKEKPVIAEEVELIIASESENIKQDMQNYTIKLEVLAGFKKNKQGLAIVSEPMWTVYNGESAGPAIMLKQTPVGDIDDKINYAYTNEYKLLNNTGDYKSIFQINRRSSLSVPTQLYNNLDPMFAQGNIVANNNTPEQSLVSAPSAGNMQQTSATVSNNIQQTSVTAPMSMPSGQNNTGGY